MRPPQRFEDPIDVLVIGGGNAGLCAAITARQAGAKVLIVEYAPRDFRGGNSRHTRNLRVMHNEPTATLNGSYSEEDYWKDLIDVTSGKTNEKLARIAIRGTREILPWMAAQGVQFQSSLSGTLNLSRTNAFFLGGGKALLNAYYLTAKRTGIQVAYNSEIKFLSISNGVVENVVALIEGNLTTIRAKAVVTASGGFQANIEWLREYWGEAADNFVIRGTPFAKGQVLRSLLDQGVVPIGDPKQCHAVAVDARAPKFDGGIVTRLDCIPFGIVVNRQARRFYDEGEDIWPKRYAIWGRLIAMQPGQSGCAIFDSKSENLFMPSVYPAVRADSIRELAQKLGLEADSLERTISEFNAAVRPGTFDSSNLDDCRTHGIVPQKTHWARAIDSPPFLGYPLRPGITFTYFGVKVDEKARVLMDGGRPCRNLFAAGEIMGGNILTEGYMAGIGMAIGAVFGRMAGLEAAKTCAKLKI
jgi:tricarballylate dehydrogenase